MRSITLPPVGLALALALSLGACATVPLIAPIRGDGLAHLNEATRVGTLVVTPRVVLEDSRCPINARCVWAGRAIVRAQVDGGGWRETINLTLGERVTTHGTTLGLTSVEPGKLAGEQPRAPQAMRFGFEGGR